MRAPRPAPAQLRVLEVGHVVVGVAVSAWLRQAHAVDDRGVVERVADDRVLLAQQRLEQAAVASKQAA